MEKQIQSFDYYSKFIGETGMQFSAISTENETHVFSMWDGYSNYIFSELCQNSNEKLPKFLKNWNEQSGWTWDDIPEEILKEEIDWLIDNLDIIKSKLDQNLEEKSYFDINCLLDLIFFIKSVKELGLKLKVSDDY